MIGAGNFKTHYMAHIIRITINLPDIDLSQGLKEFGNLSPGPGHERDPGVIRGVHPCGMKGINTPLFLLEYFQLSNIFVPLI